VVLSALSCSVSDKTTAQFKEFPFRAWLVFICVPFFWSCQESFLGVASDIMQNTGQYVSSSFIRLVFVSAFAPPETVPLAHCISPRPQMSAITASGILGIPNASTIVFAPLCGILVSSPRHADLR